MHAPGPAHAHLQQPAAREPDRLGVADRPAAVGLQPGPARPGARARARAHLDRRAGPGAPARAQQVERERRALHRQDVQAGGAGRAQRELAVARVRRRAAGAAAAAGASSRNAASPSSARWSARLTTPASRAARASLPRRRAGCRLRSPMRTLCLLAVALIAGLALTPGAAAATPHVRVVVLDADVDPVTADWIVDEIHAANDAHDSALVLQMDTPGGLLESMRKITQAELRSRVPIVAFVAPSGARAASAGFFLLQAGDIAAMVPASNTGAATPIDMGGGNVGSDLRSKLIHDAEAQMRFLASGSGRNATAAAQAVEPKSSACPRCPRSWTAAEAKQENVIDVVAADLPALLAQIDGKRHGAQAAAALGRRRHGRASRAALPAAPARRAARPQPDHAPVPGRHPRDRLRADASGHRAAGPARHRSAAARAARTLHRAVLLGRRRSARLRHRVTRARGAQPRPRRVRGGGDARGAARRRAAVPRRQLALRHDQLLAGARDRGLARADQHVRDQPRLGGAAPAGARPRRVARRRARDGRDARSIRTGRCSCTASAGRPSCADGSAEPGRARAHHRAARAHARGRRASRARASPRDEHRRMPA